MLSSLHVSSYRAIGTKGVDLLDLPQVTYLVGPNGSGKSSVLGYLLDNQLSKTYLIQDSTSVRGLIDIIEKQALCLRLTNKAIQEISEEKNILVLELMSLFSHQYKELWKEAIEICELAGEKMPDLHYTKSKDEVDNYLYGGRDKTLLLVFSILYAATIKKCSTILVEEPESRLYPALQKKIPYIFDLLSQMLPIQLFIATHSPFIMSSVARLEKNTLWESQIAQYLGNNQLGGNKLHLHKKRSEIRAKVYFLQDGQVADKHGEKNAKARYGYWGEKVIDITGFMLGSGLSDVLAEQQKENDIPTDAPLLVLCEGEGSATDAQIYNQIFAHSYLPILFISSKGVNQLERSFQLLREMKSGLSAEFRLLMIRDRDHEFLSEQDIDTWESHHKMAKVLRRRAIECYLFTEEVAEAVMQYFNLPFPEKNRIKIRSVQQRIARLTVDGIAGVDYKTELEEAFSKATNRVLSRNLSKNESVPLFLSQFVSSDSEAYKELYTIVYGK